MTFGGARREAGNGCMINDVISIMPAERGSLALPQSNQLIEDQSIEGQARAKRACARAKCPLRGDADLVDAGLARCRLDTVDQLRHLPVENIRRPYQVGPKSDEEVAVVAFLLRAGPGEQSQRLYHQRQPKTLIT